MEAPAPDYFVVDFGNHQICYAPTGAVDHQSWTPAFISTEIVDGVEFHRFNPDIPASKEWTLVWNGRLPRRTKKAVRKVTRGATLGRTEFWLARRAIMRAASIRTGG